MTRTSTTTLGLLCIALAAQRAEAAMKCGSSVCTAAQCAANPSDCNVFLQGDYVELGVRPLTELEALAAALGRGGAPLGLGADEAESAADRLRQMARAMRGAA